MDSFIGSVIFEFWGALLVYIFQLAFRPLIGKKPRAFKEIYNGGKKEKNAGIFLNGSIHIIVGILSVVFTLLLLNK
ncbi:hypothetical protein [uncultured Marivirga sp.]|uniref:hypothetical protein n=1 Tax=uncultured Marivirga sp. TaxID=1123707 RepID=UPI0030EF14FE|tara:strand:- start:196978 stop:197205 length:228 start_codon:yes stop_codon:yes gene_type:complete